MKKEDMSVADLLLEALAILSAILYLGLQVYYGFLYQIRIWDVILNIVVLLLIYTGLTMLQFYPERVNWLSKKICQGKIRQYTLRMLRLIKLIFVLSLLFTSICDILGYQVNSVYSMVVVLLVAGTAVYYETKIIRIIRDQQPKT